MSQTTKNTQTTENTENTENSENTENTDIAGSSDTLAELRALVAGLAGRVAMLEEEADQRHPEVSEEVLLAISAACAAFLGKRATVKQVHLRRGSTWAATGRAAAQQMHADLHGYGDRQTTLTPHARRGTT